MKLRSCQQRHAARMLRASQSGKISRLKLKFVLTLCQSADGVDDIDAAAHALNFGLSLKSRESIAVDGHHCGTG